MSEKRKGGADGGPSTKRKRAGNKGKWTTTHQTERLASKAEVWGAAKPVGMAGVWLTCARGMERKAGKEVNALYERYAKKMYGIEPEAAAAAGKSGEGGEPEENKDDPDDIAAMIQRELAEMKKDAKQPHKHIIRYDMSLTCVGFSCLKPPLDPVAIVEQICIDTKAEADAAAALEEEAVRTGQPATPTVRSCKYVNRLTPVTTIGKATVMGIKSVARTVLGEYFKLVAKSEEEVAAEAAEAADAAEKANTAAEAEGEGEADAESEAEDAESEAADEEKQPYSFSIRASIRRHDGLGARQLVDQVAQVIDQSHHKVNLTNPDKVILVEVFKNTIGMSVVSGAWEAELRKFNITAIYNQARKDAADAWKAKEEAAASGQAAAKAEEEKAVYEAKTEKTEKTEQ